MTRDAPERVRTEGGRRDSRLHTRREDGRRRAAGVHGSAVVRRHCRGEGRQPVSVRVERGNLLDSGEPRTLLEWAVKAANRPRSYAAMFVASVGSWILLTLAGFPGIGAAFLFGALLLVMQWFLRFCWPYIESFYDDEPSPSDPESLRFEGLSSDLKVFLTLFAVTFLVLMGLILAGGTV